MRRTYTDVDAYLEQRLGNRTDMSPTMRGHWLNDSVKLVANMFEHPEMQGLGVETLLATQDSLAPTVITDLWWPEMLRNVKTGQPIILRPKVEIEGLQTKASTNPTRFHWWARRFYFDSRPTADTAIQVWYRKQPVLWSDGPCQLDEVYDPIVELYSQVVAFQFYREFDKSQFAETQATNYIGKMNLPLRENKKNDYMSGIQVRTR